MKKLFISQPMRDRTDEQILAEREAAIESAQKFLKEDVEVIDSFFKDVPESGCVPLKHLARSLDFLADADVAYFANGWEDARGCRIEHECAVAYGIPAIGAIKTCR